MGADEFINEMLKKIDSINLTDIPKSQFRTEKYTQREIEQIASSRNESIQIAYQSGQFSLKNRRLFWIALF